MAKSRTPAIIKKTLLQGLGILSRPRAFVLRGHPCKDSSNSSSRVHEVLQGSPGVDPSRIGRIDGADFREMIKQGWVTLKGDQWRVARAGRYHLKRNNCAADPFQGQHQERGAAVVRREGRAESVLTNHAESPLAWLRKRRGKDGRSLVSDAQFEAGERLRADFHFAQMSPRITANWSDGINTGTGRRQGGSGSDIADHVISAKARVDAAIAGVGPELSAVLVDVCCYLKGLEATEKSRGWPQRSGKIVLALALNALARHYGLLACDKPSSRRARMEHWGVSDFRPGLDVWQ